MFNFLVKKHTHTHKHNFMKCLEEKKPQIKRVWIVIYNIMMALYL